MHVNGGDGSGAFFLLPLWEMVVREARRMRGLSPRIDTPHPPSLREGTFSHKGRREEEAASPFLHRSHQRVKTTLLTCNYSAAYYPHHG